MMSQSWMGTDFTNDDLVKEASIVEDYTHTCFYRFNYVPLFRVKSVPPNGA
jgi:hypothetical protein